MLGAIKKRDIMRHPFLTIRCFGMRVFLHTLVAPPSSTFLSVLVANRTMAPPQQEVSRLFGRCIQLEEMAQQVYRRLAEIFPEHEEVCRFFELLAKQEEQNAELLELCHHEAGRCGWDQECADALERIIPRSEAQLEEAMARAEYVESVHDALGLLLEVVEMSEVNRAFFCLVSATDSDFVRFFPAFQRSTRSHLAFVARRVREMDPSYASRCNDILRCIESSDAELPLDDGTPRDEEYESVGSGMGR